MQRRVLHYAAGDEHPPLEAEAGTDTPRSGRWTVDADSAWNILWLPGPMSWAGYF